MRVLLLTQWYPPEPQKVVADIAVQLREMGHEVTVLTGYPNFPSGKLYDGYRMRLVMREEIEGVPVIRVPLFPDHSRSILRRALNLLSFAAMATFIGPFVVPRVDVLYVIQPVTSLVPAVVISRCGWVPVVFEVQDLWPETLKAAGFVRNRALLSIVGAAMKLVYRFVDGIRFISPGFCENLRSRGIPEAKLWMIPNWVDVEWYQPLPPDPELAESLGLSGKFNVMFAGTMGHAQDLGTVLDAADRLRDIDKVQFVMVGGGTLRDALKNEAQQRGLSNVRFLGTYPQNEIARIQSIADVLLVHLRDEALFRITIPHKTLGYMACGKPVLIGVAGDAADVVMGAGAGLSCRPSDPDSMAEAVRRFYRMPESERHAMGFRARNAAVQQFSRQELVGCIGEMLQVIVARRGIHRTQSPRRGNATASDRCVLPDETREAEPVQTCHRGN